MTPVPQLPEPDRGAGIPASPALQHLARVTVHALLIFAVLHLTRPLATAPGFQYLYSMLAPGEFTIFSASCAAALHNAKYLIPIILTVTILATWPFTMPEFAGFIIPIAAGVLAGNALRGIIKEQVTP